MAEETVAGGTKKGGDDAADAKLLELAKKRFRQAEEAESEIRRLALEDKQFANGDQWPEDIKALRIQQKRPCLTINKIPAFTQQITNEQRQNPVGIQVNPVDDDGDPDTAQVIEGLCRHIEYQSGADQAYSWAHEDSVVSGFGYWRVLTKYRDAMSFEQEIWIERIKNCFSVFFDPAAEQADYSDAKFAFIISMLPREEYEESYGKSSPVTNWQSDGTGWLLEDSIRVAEYFYREDVQKQIVLMSDGTVQLAEVVDKEGFVFPPRVAEVRRRSAAIPFVKWVRMTGDKVLERGDWPGQWIPIVPVLGKEIDIDGKKVLKGAVRDAKDPARQFNFMETAATEAIALAPKAPFIAYEGQLEGHEDQWKTMNTSNTPVLFVKPVSLNGQVAPLPQRQQAEPPIQAMMLACRQAADDLKGTFGIYDAALGAQGNEKSGSAILARQQQSQMGNLHFQDNLLRGVRHTGRIIIDLIPKVYDTQRVLRIIGADGTHSTVTVNAKPGQGSALPPGVAKVYDLTVGKYDVTVSAGPSYQTKRQQAVTSMLDLVGHYPQLMQICGDLLVKNMDWPGAKEIAERLARTIPPNLTMDDEPMDDVPMEAQARFSQLMQQLKTANEQIQKQQQEIQMQLAPKQAELESNERIEFAKLQEKRDKDQMDAQLKREQMQVDLATAQATIDRAAADASIAAQQKTLAQREAQAHELGLAVVKHDQEQELQEQQQQQQQQAEPVAAGGGQ